MKRLTCLAIAISLLVSGSSLVLTGCVPVMIGAIAYSSVKSSQQKKEFVNDFHTTNVLRHEAGLPPLDLCTEKYKFDKYWARQDPECKEKIKEFDKDEKAYTSKEAEQLQSVIENR